MERVLLFLIAAALATEPEPEPLPDAGLAVVPFGVPQFAWKRPVRGVLYALTQAGGVGVATWAGLERSAAIDADDEDAMSDFQSVMAVGVGAAAVSYAVGMIDGSRLAEDRARAAAESVLRRDTVLEFDAGLALARAAR